MPVIPDLRIAVLGQPQQNISETPSQQQTGCASACLSFIGQSIGRRIMVQGPPGQKA
jgi:hypothetical protein